MPFYTQKRTVRPFGGGGCRRPQQREDDRQRPRGHRGVERGSDLHRDCSAVGGRRALSSRSLSLRRGTRTTGSAAGRKSKRNARVALR